VELLDLPQPVITEKGGCPSQVSQESLEHALKILHPETFFFNIPQFSD
jgi:hypothetical protein